VGSAGGLLIGVRLDDLDRCCICGVWCSLELCAGNKEKRQMKLSWVVINVYDPTQQELRDDFFAEMTSRVHSTDLPKVMGGDGNLIRFSHAKIEW
jgi:hypothetical protein